MRAWLAFLLAALSALPLAQAQTAICGRMGYPDAANFSAEAVVDGPLWDSFRSGGGFSGGVEGIGAVSTSVPDGDRMHEVTLTELSIKDFVGGEFTEVTVLALRARTVRGTQVLATYNFTHVSVGGRSGGNLTIVARLDGGAVDIFWRWAWLPCTEDFPNAYYVFHGRVDGGAIVDDNTLVYFEAPRPRRGPPADLVLLIVAGIAASVIFLFAHRALRRKS